MSKKVESGDSSFLLNCCCKSTLFLRNTKKINYFCKVMIQRIQTIFLLLVVFSQVALHFIGLNVALFGSKFVIATITLVSFIFAIVSIFSYKKRQRQILLNNFNIFINVLLTGLLIYWLLNLSGGIHFPEKGIELTFPLISLFCLSMANKFIKKDEKLVKSVDRIR